MELWRQMRQFAYAPRHRGAHGRLFVIPLVLWSAVPFGLLVALYLAFADYERGEQVEWAAVLVRWLMAVSAPILLALAWRYSRPSRRVTHVFDWVGAGLLAFSVAWLTAGLTRMLADGSLDLLGTLLIPVGWSLWSLAGTMLMVLGIASLSSEMLTEMTERQRLQALVDFGSLMTSLDYQAIPEGIVTHLAQLLKSDACVLYLWDDAKAALRPAATHHNPAVYDEGFAAWLESQPCPKGSGVPGRVMETGEPELAADALAYPGAKAGRGDRQGESAIAVPVQVETHRLGVLWLVRQGSNPFSEDDLRLVQGFGTQAALVIEHGRLLRELSERSITDNLTGLYNARHFEQVLAVEISRAEREERPLALLMLDSDALKRMNDQFGHQRGNEYLRGIAQVIRSNIRLGDYAFRYAGDEFLVLLPGTGMYEAQQVAERIRRIIDDEQSLPGVAGTVSIGIAVLPFHAHDGESLLGAADGAMYESKRRGKNRVTIAGDA